jgi:hypothetical protein
MSNNNILPNGINTNGRSIAGLDWSRQEVIVNVEGQPLARFKTLSEAAPNYENYIWVLESTADSFELQNRQIDLDAIEKANIEAYCFNPKFTSIHRIKWNDIIKTDEADTEVIRKIFTETKITCCKFKQLCEKDELREKINQTIIKDRQYDGDISVPLAKKYLPNFKDTPLNLVEFLYKPETIKSKNPKNPTPKVQIGRMLIAAEKVRENGLGFRTFRRQIGNYGQGYGCMIRSDYNWWMARTITNNRLKKMGIEKTTKNSHIDPKTKEEKVVRIWTPEETQVKKQVFKEMQLLTKWLWNLTK